MLQFTARVMMFIVLLSASVLIVYDIARKFLKEDGNYSNWSLYSECSKTCGNAKRVRYRTCSNPPPRFGGQNCSRFGEATELIRCDTPPCPVDGKYSEWRKWSECSSKCNGGETMRSRKCANPFPRDGGRTCLEQGLGAEIERQPCNEDVPCPVNGGFSEWSDFSDCSATCSGGTRTRTRTCDDPAPSNGGKDCRKLGPDAKTEACNTQPCPADGGYGEWSKFTTCSVTCGGGVRERHRKCDDPAPVSGGRDCEGLGPSVEAAACNNQVCPTNTQTRTKLNARETDA